MTVMLVEHAINTNCPVARFAEIRDRLAWMSLASNRLCKVLSKFVLRLCIFIFTQTGDKAQKLKVDFEVLSYSIFIDFSFAYVAASQFVIMFFNDFLDAICANSVGTIRQDGGQVMIFVKGFMAPITLNYYVALFIFHFYI